MKYTKLVLSGFKRLALKNIHYFEINPTAPVQLILGTNGSGKSSIISELSPLPANIADFANGGYKEIHIEHEGNNYVLKSSFNPKQEHYFIKNGGDNLNPGGTVSVQKELVSQVFGFNQDIQDLLLSKTRFTRMSPSERRYWITKLCNTNFDYAIKVYNKLREKHRDTTGAIKTLKKRLVQETEKIVDIDFQSKLEKEVDFIHKVLNDLLERRKPLEENKEQLEQIEKELYSNIASLSKLLTELCRSNPGCGAISYDELDNQIAIFSGNIQAQEVISRELITDIEKIDSALDALEKTQGASIDELSATTLRHQNKKEKLLKELEFVFDDTVSWNTYSESLSSVQEALNSIFTQLPPNPDKYFSRATFQELTLKQESLVETRNKVQIDLTTLQGRKQHQELHRDTQAITCPKCTHSWHLNYSEQTYNNILEHISIKETEILQLSQEIDKNKEVLLEIQKYFQTFTSYTQLSKSWPVLKPLWEKISNSSALFQNPTDCLNIVNVFSNQTLLKKELDDIDLEINKCIKLINLAKEIGEQDTEKLKTTRNAKESTLYDLGLSIAKNKTEVLKLRKTKTNKKEIDTIKQTLQEHLTQTEKLFDRTKEAIRREMFNECIRTIQTSLSRKELAISEIRGQRSIIGDIENQIAFLEKDEKALKLLVDELSPTDGLIAEGLFGFIKLFVKQMNYFISKVWSYKLELQPCSVESDEKVDLDYKFPVVLPDNSAVVPDISKCSTGQEEIINLAFLVPAMKQLGFGSNPIMLDEFAANMDNSHRVAAITVVKSLIDQHPFSQLFMVNHYEGIYGAFTNAQTTVLCDENIILPKDCVYNRHVVIR